MSRKLPRVKTYMGSQEESSADLTQKQIPRFLPGHKDGQIDGKSWRTTQYSAAFLYFYLYFYKA